MAFAINDRVKETSTTTGTGTLNLGGAADGFDTFVAGIGDGNVTYYSIAHATEDEWEVGIGTVTDASTDTLSRSTILSSSNSDSAVSFSAGTKSVFCTMPASKIAYADNNNNFIIGTDAAGVDYNLTFRGEDNDGVLTWMEDEDYFKFGDDVLINSTEKLMFQDTGTYVYSSTDGQLDLVADTEIQIAATTIDINGAVALNGAITGATNITLSGELDAATLDISGNADIDGTTNLDAVDIDGAVQLDATFTVGADDQGYDIKFFGDTASAYMLWDTSADDLVLAGAAGIDLAGDIDVDGTANLDNTDIDGTFAVDGTTISLDATTSLNIDNSNTSNGITIATATSGVPISIGHSTSETTVNDNLTVTGNFTVSGTSTTVDSTTVAVGDSLLKLAKDQGTSSDAVDFGFYGVYGVGGTAKYAGIFRDLSATGDPFTFFDALQAEPGTTVNTGGTGYDLADISAGGATFADDIDVDGTTNLDAVDIDGAVQIDNTITVGADDQGYDIIFYGDTASANMTWDTSADDLILAGAARIVVPASGLVIGSTAVTATGAELNYVDGVTSAIQTQMDTKTTPGFALAMAVAL